MFLLIIIIITIIITVIIFSFIPIIKLFLSQAMSSTFFFFLADSPSHPMGTGGGVNEQLHGV